jgi:RNA polymerase sigma-70 factor (ECF subfamily)
VAIFEAEVDYVYWVLRRFGAAPIDAEDLCQEVFLAMWRRRDTYDPERPLRPWIAGIAFRVKQQHRRRGARELLRGFVDQPDQAPLPDERLEAAGTQSLVVDVLAQLPERQRTVLVLHDIDGMPMRQIAEVLAIPMFTLYSRLRTARRTFAKQLRRAMRSSSIPVEGLAQTVLAQEKTPARAPARARRRVAARLEALVASTERTPPSPPLPVGRGPWPLIVASALVGLGLLALVRPSGGGSPPALASLAARGLIGYWRFDDPRGSTVARDLSGRGNDCLLRRLDPDRAWIAGKHGGGLALDGHGWLECPRAGALASLSGEITIGAWVTRTGNASRYHALVALQKDRGRLDEFMFGFADGELLFSSHVWRGKMTRPIRQPTTDAGWAHIAVSRHRDGRTVLFVDGREVGQEQTGQATLDSLVNPLIIGAAMNGPDPRRAQSHFSGAVDELVIYDEALDAAAIAALAAGRPPAQK